MTNKYESRIVPAVFRTKFVKITIMKFFSALMGRIYISSEFLDERVES